MTWTYGAEHELADWQLGDKLPVGCSHDGKDYTIVNSNGIANDPSGKLWRCGGEVNTAPSDIDGQVNMLGDLVRVPGATVNYRSNLHLHIRVPGLADDLGALKRVQGCLHTTAPFWLPTIDPIPTVPRSDKDGRRRWRRRRVSHHSLLTPTRLDRQMAARTTEEFFEAEVPRSKAGKVMWHAQARLCVNLRQLRETDTVEFRHFCGTTDTGLLREAFRWCEEWLYRALAWDFPMESAAPWVDDLMTDFNQLDFACISKPLIDYDLERGYRMTCHDGSLTKDQIARNIEEVLSWGIGS